ncbi:MAG: (2Fe-2S)-binding protein [Candidatus Muiribacteriota bacterium]
MCSCMGIDKKTIEEAAEHGAFSYESIQEKTGAGTGACKGERCKEKILDILDKYNC